MSRKTSETNLLNRGHETKYDDTGNTMNDDISGLLRDIHYLYNKIQFKWTIIDLRNITSYDDSHILNSTHIDIHCLAKQIKNILKHKPIIVIRDDSIKDNELIQFYNIVKPILRYKNDEIYFLKTDYNAFQKEYHFMCSDYENIHDSLPRELKLQMYPNCIIPDKLYLGNVKQRSSRYPLKDLKITHVVDLAGTYNIKSMGIKYYQIFIFDFEGANIGQYFDCATKWIDDALNDDNNRVFIHCQMGISRAPSITIAYLMKYKNMNLFQAYKHTHKCREIIWPNDGFFDQLSEYEIKIYGKTTKKNIEELGLRNQFNCCYSCNIL